MKTIFVPTDFSDNAEKALEFAVCMAKKENARILLFHAFHMPYVSPDVPMDVYSGQVSVIRDQARDQLSMLCKTVKDTAQISCEQLLIQGAVVESITEHALYEKADLIIMGTKGASGLREVLVGSNAAKVALRSTCPVMVVPEQSAIKNIQKIVYATNFHVGDLSALRQLIHITSTSHPEIQIVHVADVEHTPAVDNVFMEKFSMMIKRKIGYDAFTYHLLSGTDAEKELEEYLRAEGIDALALSTKYRSIVERIFGKSFTRKLVCHSTLPLIVFHHS